MNTKIPDVKNSVKCFFHPQRPASHTDAIPSPSSESLSGVEYKCVPICALCALERSEATTSRVEPRASYIDPFDVAGPEPATPLAGDLPEIRRRIPADFAGEPAVSRGHGVQGDPATAATCTTLALETAAGIQLEELADVSGEGDNGWNACRRNDIARKMQLIAAGGANHYAHDELVGAVIRAERGELRGR